MGNQRSHLHVGVYMLVVIFLCLSLLDGQASALGLLSHSDSAPPQRAQSHWGEGTRAWPNKSPKDIKLLPTLIYEDAVAASPDPAQYTASFLSMVLFLFLLLRAAYQMCLLKGCAAFACPDISILSRFLGGHAPPLGGWCGEVDAYALS